MPALGILMLDTGFHRPPGDVGNPATWPFPVLYARVAGQDPDRVVRGAPDLDRFVAAGQRLAARGAGALLTSCGFLAAHQAALAAALPVPIATSALLLAPLLARCQPGGGRVGVVTYDREALGPTLLEAAGVAPDLPVAGLPRAGAFHGLIERGEPYDRARLEAEAVDVARALVAASPEISCLLLECTNLPPFSAAIAAATGRPVHDAVGLGLWLQGGLAPARHAA